jgi:hypothetical protein
MVSAITAFRTAFLTARASDTAFSIQNNNQAMMNNAAAAGRLAFSSNQYPMQAMATAHQMEKDLVARNLTAKLQGDMADAELESLQKKRDKNIAQSFNYFA